MGGKESITITGSCLASKLPETFELAKEMIYEPRWDVKEFDLAKNQTIEGLKRTESSPAAIAQNVFGKLDNQTRKFLILLIQYLMQL